MRIERLSPCKINLLLNILGQRPDGFHELETLMQPLPICDTLSIERARSGLTLTCSDPGLPVNETNLVHRAARRFLETIQRDDALSIHLEKRIPIAAGLGGGSSNAAATLLGLNELFGHPLTHERLHSLAAGLGSDVPFFLQTQPALATGRGEVIEPLAPFPALHGTALLLVQPGFGIATAWAYQQLARFPDALHGRAGRARVLARALATGETTAACDLFYNSLEAPALEKYPWLGILQDFLRQDGALGTLMSGSGSTTFAVFPSLSAAQESEGRLHSRFGKVWAACTPL